MNIYKVTSEKSQSELPLFEIRDYKLYRTSSHPDGLSGHHIFEIKGNKIYSSDESSISHHFEIKNYQLFRTDAHPDGICEEAEFEIR